MLFGKLLLTGVLAMGIAAAQSEMGGGMGGRGGGGGGAGRDMGPSIGGAPRRVNRVAQIADKLKLSKEQRDEFVKILVAASPAAAAARMEADKARAEIAGAIIEGKPAEEVNKIAGAYAGVAAKLTKVEADAFAKIYATLKPNQQAKAAEAFELMAGVFSAPAAGVGRGPSRGQGR